jgi:3-hydroxyisobutyrate dehydrogenase
MDRIGFVGVGNMGAAMVRAMLRGGYDVMAYDLRPEPLAELASNGARIAKNPVEVAAHAELLCLAIAGDAAVEDALIGSGNLVGLLEATSVIAIHSTIHPSIVRRIAERAASKGIDVIDATVSGGRTAADAGTLAFMIGGDAEVIARCRPIFSSFGSIFHMGALGTGVVTKIAQQMMTTANIVGVDEGTRLAEACGVDLRTFLTVVAATTGQSHVADGWLDGLKKTGPSMANSFYTSLNPAVELAGELGVPVPGTALAQQLIRSIFKEST